MHEQDYSEPEAGIVSIRCFNNLLKEGKLIDTTISHISLYSMSVLRDMRNATSNGKIFLQDYAYTGRLLLDSDIVLQVYKLGIELSCFWIRKWCVDFIEEWFNEFDPRQIWDLAKATGNATLTKLCVQSTLKSVDIQNLEEKFYKNLHVESIPSIVGQYRKMTDLDKLEFISNWLKTSGNKISGEEFGVVLKCIDLKKIEDVSILEIMSGVSKISFIDEYRQILFNEYYNAREDESEENDCCSPCSSSIYGVESGSSQQLPDIKYFFYGYNNDSHGGRILSLYPEVEEIQCEVPFRYFFAIVIFHSKDTTAESTSIVNRIDMRQGNLRRVADLHQKRSDHCATTFGENIFVFGGADSTNDTILNSCEIYDSKIDSWTLLPNMPTARRACAAIGIPNFGILVVGGSDETGLDSEGLCTCELLTETQNTWGWKNYASMRHSRIRARGVHHNGRVYVTSHDDLSVDMLTIQQGTQGQWTLIPVINPPEDTYIWSMTVSEAQVLLSTREGNVYRMELKQPEAKTPNAVEWIITIAIVNYQQPTILALR